MYHKGPKFNAIKVPNLTRYPAQQGKRSEALRSTQHFSPFQIPNATQNKAGKNYPKSFGNATSCSITAPAIIQLRMVPWSKPAKLWKVEKLARKAGQSKLFLSATENAKNASSVQKITLWQSYYKNIIGLLCKLAMLCLPQ